MVVLDVRVESGLLEHVAARIQKPHVLQAALVAHQTHVPGGEGEGHLWDNEIKPRKEYIQKRIMNKIEGVFYHLSVSLKKLLKLTSLVPMRSSRTNKSCKYCEETS